jgi:hypothetical protein
VRLREDGSHVSHDVHSMPRAEETFLEILLIAAKPK